MISGHARTAARVHALVRQASGGANFPEVFPGVLPNTANEVLLNRVESKVVCVDACPELIPKVVHIVHPWFVVQRQGIVIEVRENAADNIENVLLAHPLQAVRSSPDEIKRFLQEPFAETTVAYIIVQVVERDQRVFNFVEARYSVPIETWADAICQSNKPRRGIPTG